MNKKKETDAFYKQTLFGLLKDFSFGIWVTFSKDHVENKLKETLMPYGAVQGMMNVSFYEEISLPEILKQDIGNDHNYIELHEILERHKDIIDRSLPKISTQ